MDIGILYVCNAKFDACYSEHYCLKFINLKDCSSLTSSRGRNRRKDNKNFGHVYNQKFNGDFVTVDNSMVVPYSPEILKKYKCYINVEYCASIMSIKYI